MTASFKRHRELERKLIDGRNAGTLTESEDDALLEEMDDLWWKMTTGECQTYGLHTQGGQKAGT